ncbi:ABC transporter permease [Bacillus sp. FJAT-27264]|uniref:Sugar ABC transporter permease n=1 Tax=Paenibacillus agri TaxID=2744309 RepID=A0A850EGY5_9BACL|nr:MULTISPECIES: sugar ABC transporter permease [Bacillales]NUU60088.1 sugar ABC transporter permease [Paenibacillus agri]OBZ19458.1 ABC transporter permease [Bacillus sp. FJAT-27264]
MLTHVIRLTARKSRELFRVRLSYQTQRYLFIYIVLGIPLLYFLSTRMLPIFYAFNVSVREWNLLSSEKPFVGFENFSTIFSDEIFSKSILNTFKFVLIGVPGQLIAGLAVALLLQSIYRFRGFFRTIYFIPYVTSIVAVSWVFRWILMRNGWLNEVLLQLGIEPQLFLQSPRQALILVTLTMIWQSIGFQMLVFMTGLEAIPRMYYEAASIDGASGWRKFVHITLPLLNPVIVFSAVIGVISYLQSFGQVLSMTNGGPLNSTTTMVLYIYNLAFQQFKMGRAAAATVVLFAIILVLTLLQLKVLNKKVEY